MVSDLVVEPSLNASADGHGQPYLLITGLRKHYGPVVAVDIGRLQAHQGQLLTLLGPSGCGKTTTLRSIAGLVQPEAGTIAIGGRDITSEPTHRRNLGMVFQNYAIFPHMTVFDNVAYGLQNRGLNRHEIRMRVREVLSLVELSDYEHRYRHQLSGGQQQRVALARAIVYQPDLLLLDEPFSNLDAKLRKTMRLEVRKLQQRLGLTTVFVTHDQQEALSLSDVVAVMNGGRVEQVGTPPEIYEQPGSEFVADFIGSTNLLPGTVRAYEAQCSRATVEIDGGGIVQVGHAATLAPGRRVKILAKPDKLRLRPDAAESWPAAGRVSSVAYLGSVTQYQVDLPSCTLEVVVPSDQAPSVSVGTSVGLELRSEALRLLEA